MFLNPPKNRLSRADASALVIIAAGLVAHLAFVLFGNMELAPDEALF